MNKTTDLPPQSPLILAQTAKSETPSKTTCPSRLHLDRPRLMPPSADWTADEVLTLDEMCDRYIRWMLNRCGGDRQATAQFLGIGRTSLYRYLKKMGLEKRGGDRGLSDLRALHRSH